MYNRGYTLYLYLMLPQLYDETVLRVGIAFTKLKYVNFTHFPILSKEKHFISAGYYLNPNPGKIWVV